jgi:protein-disulfide isomerase
MCVKGVLGALILVLLTACGMVSQLVTSPSPAATATPTALPPGYTVSGKTRGDPNAKVTLVVFSDFQ